MHALMQPVQASVQAAMHLVQAWMQTGHSGRRAVHSIQHVSPTVQALMHVVQPTQPVQVPHEPPPGFAVPERCASFAGVVPCSGEGCVPALFVDVGGSSEEEAPVSSLAGDWNLMTSRSFCGFASGRRSREAGGASSCFSPSWRAQPARRKGTKETISYAAVARAKPFTRRRNSRRVQRETPDGGLFAPGSSLSFSIRRTSFHTA
jgi:hypothetical protein